MAVNECVVVILRGEIMSERGSQQSAACGDRVYSSDVALFSEGVTRQRLALLVWLLRLLQDRQP
jgi:hypothetical protein